MSASGPQRPFVPVPPSSEGEAITDLQGRVANPIHSDSRCQVHGAVGEEKTAEGLALVSGRHDVLKMSGARFVCQLRICLKKHDKKR
jgi:hypothetical protein